MRGLGLKRSGGMSFTQFHNGLKLTASTPIVAPSSAAVTTPKLASSSFQLLSLLPPPLLALVACHLDYDDLLRMQRCSSALRRLRSDESYMAVAWSGAGLCLETRRSLIEWTILEEDCVRLVAATRVHGDTGVDFIPVHVWQTAQPALQAAVAKRELDDSEKEQWHQRLQQLRQWQLQRLRQWVEQPQPTKRILARRGWGSAYRPLPTPFSSTRLCEADTDRESPSAAEERVEVLRDVTRERLAELQPEYRDVEVRCRLVLQACPALQHLALGIDSLSHVEPSHEDTFALVPHLRSLRLYQNNSLMGAPELLITEPPVDFERMLDSLPHLTSLRCKDIYISISDLLDLASHSTLEQLHIVASGQHLADKRWLGDELRIPSSLCEEELEQAVARVTLDGHLEAEAPPIHRFDSAVLHGATINDESEIKMPAWTRDDMQRMQAALTRTQPTRRSCETRLALADWLHRRLRRGGLHTDAVDHPAWLLRHYRSQVALLRSTLQRQLSELASAAASVKDAGTERLEQLRLLHRWLQERIVACESAAWRALFYFDDLDESRRQLNTAMSRPMRALLLANLGKKERKFERSRRSAAELHMQVQLLAGRVASMQQAVAAEPLPPCAAFDRLLVQARTAFKYHCMFWNRECQRAHLSRL